MATLVLLLVGAICLYLLWLPIYATLKMGGWVAKLIWTIMAFVIVVWIFPVVIMTAIVAAFWIMVIWLAIKIFLALTRD